MNLTKWFKDQAIALVFSFSNVEKNALSQKQEGLENNTSQEIKHNQGNLMDSLMRGELTTEVSILRWRIYKTFESSKRYSVGKDRKVTTKHIKDISYFKVDPFDTYPVEMIVFNNEITTDVLNTLENDKIDLSSKISSLEHSINNKPERPIVVHRESLVKFEIERYTKKLVIRKINDKERLLSFCVSVFPDEDNRTTRLFISDIKKAIINPRASNMLEISRVGFITDGCVGAPDFMEYQYRILSFDKIDEFEGEYIIKFKAEIIIDGVNILDQYRDIALDERYERKEKRKNTSVNYTDL